METGIVCLEQKMDEEYTHVSESAWKSGNLEQWAKLSITNNSPFFFFRATACNAKIWTNNVANFQHLIPQSDASYQLGYSLK